MDNKIQVLKDVELLGQQFAVYGTPEEPLFLAKDVASWIELTNVSDMIQRVDEDEATKLNLGGQRGESWFLTESGLYEVLMQSRKPIAKQFKRGVKKILHEIRVSGRYTPQLPQTFAEALRLAADKIEENERLLVENNKLSHKLADIQPKAEYYDKILRSPDPLVVTQIAKDYGMSPQELNKRLKA